MFASRQRKKDYYLDYENTCCSHGTKKDEFFNLKTRAGMNKLCGEGREFFEMEKDSDDFITG